jgi:predicted TIM-barrel fold metal-dependent hydrolase
MLRLAGLERAVLVQPAHYGFDHAALLDALQIDGRTRGIALADADVADETLDSLHRAGVRGLRFTELRNPDGSVRPGSVGADQLIRLVPRLRERGWQAHLWAGPDSIDALLPVLVSLHLPVVVDHMGMPDIAAGVADARFQRLLAAVREGAIWVKLSVCRLASDPAHADVRPFHDALVEANPLSLLWGSDWPFIRMMERSPDVGRLLDRFSAWVEDAGLRQTILADNPARLFGFRSMKPRTA